LLLTEVDEGFREPVAHLAPGVFRQAESARRADAFEPRGDVDGVAEEVAVRILDDVAEVDAGGTSMRRSAGTGALRSARPLVTSSAQRTASTTLRNSTTTPSPA